MEHHYNPSYTTVDCELFNSFATGKVLLLQCVNVPVSELFNLSHHTLNSHYTFFLGATPIVTAGSKEKIERAISLGADAGFNYKDEDFSTKVLEATNGKI